MTYREEIKELRNKVHEYEELLEELTQGPKISGTIVSRVKDGLVRISADGGEERILSVNPDIAYSIKEGTRVIANQVMVSQILPEELEKTPEEVQFDYIEWSQIAGIKSQVERIKEAINAPTLYGQYYKEYNMAPCKGILLYGPAGCGKTLIAKAIASSFLKKENITKDSFIYMKGGEMLSPYVGMAELNIKSAFERARRNHKKTGTKSIIFIDEAEAILPARGSRRSSDVETTIVPTFLSEMDGFEENGAFVILATNYPQQLDPAVIRPGRIDLKVEITRPDKSDAIDIFELYLKKTKCLDIPEIAKRASEEVFKSGLVRQVSGALIKNLVDRAILYAMKRAASSKRDILPSRDRGVLLDDIISAINEETI